MTKMATTIIYSKNCVKQPLKNRLHFSPQYTIANTRFLSKQSICKVWNCYIQRLRRRCIYKKSNNIISPLTLTLGQGHTWNIAQYPLHHMTYSPAKFEVALSNCLGGKAFTTNIWFDPRSRSHGALSYTSCNLCTCQVWSCYSKWLRRCIYK